MRALAAITLATLVGCATAGCADKGDSAVEDDDCAFGGVDTYTAGIEKISGGGLFTVAITAADPAPPDRGDNTWSLLVLDAGGTAVEGGVVVIEPFMPAHGHGTTPATFDAEARGDGAYEVGPFDLFMPGLWEVAVDVIDSAGASDDAVFTFCVEG